MVLAKAAIAVLAVTVMFGSVSVCPRGGLTCPMQKASGHRCCGSQTSLRVNDCCARGAASAATVVKAGVDRDHRLAGTSVLPLTWQPSMVSPAHGFAAPCWQARYGPAPPDTPITQHTTLLL